MNLPEDRRLECLKLAVRCHNYGELTLRPLKILRVSINKIIMIFSWLNLMKMYDALFKNNWNILEDDMREHLDREFMRMNRKFNEEHSELSIPKNYYSKNND